MRWSMHRDKRKAQILDEDDGPATVVLTGSTGNVGSYLLDALALNTRVASIHCLARSDDAESRQTRLMKQRGLSTSLPKENIHFHTCDFEKQSLGLDTATAEKITSTATHYIHCAWPVDWNQSFASFKPALDGVSHLIQLILNAEKPGKLFFISSVAAAGNWGSIPGAQQDIPEEEIDDWKAARFGYGQSKLVAERLIADACRTGGLTSVICRVGQVAGPVDHGSQGSWPAQEWLPALVLSSKQMQLIPKTLGPMEEVNWVPVDRVSSVIVELLFESQLSGSVVFRHIVNPRKAVWNSLLSTVQQATGNPKSVDLADWVNVLREKGNEEDGATELSAFKLLSFFEDIADKAVHLPKSLAPSLSAKHSTTKSPTLAELKAVDDEWMSMWLDQMITEKPEETVRNTMLIKSDEV